MVGTIWDRVENTLVGVLGALAMIVGLAQVLGRYFFQALAITWAEEVIVYLVIWAVMIISSQLVRTDGHVRPDLVLRAPAAGLAALGRGVQLPRRVGLLRRHGLVRLGHRQQFVGAG